MTERAGAQHAGRAFCLWALLVLVLSSCVANASRPHLLDGESQRQKVAAVRHLTQQVASSLNQQRQLLQSGLCPEGCVDGFCRQDSTYGGLRCQKCSNNLIVDKINGTCACPAGKYTAPGTASCSDCPKSFWCPGGEYTAANPPPKNECPSGMTTLGLRSTSSRSCVNLPGYSYSISATGAPAATVCPADTYGPGLKKQRACVPCPTGFTTAGVAGARQPTACVVPAGYYLKGPGQAAPCPKGEWKSGVGANGNCTKCAFGVTTSSIASTTETNCTIVVPGYYASQMEGAIVTAVAVCPQKFYCSGGRPVGPFDPLKPTWIAPNDLTVKACPDGLWTQSMGATNLQQCLTPPGFKTVGGATVPCGTNEFRADWKPAAEASSCSSCGEGVYALQTDQVSMFDATTGSETLIQVTSTSEDCYIYPGMGLMYNSITKSWRAVKCDNNNYGAANMTFGLTPAPCKPCPTNMVTSKDNTTYPNSARWYVANDDNTGGFVNTYACVNQAGYGYNGRISQKCDQGYYNAKDTYTTCRACGSGLTTLYPGAGTSFQDCGIAPGYGYNLQHFFNKSVVICPIGTYNDRVQLNRSTPCTPCPTGRTTSAEGATTVDDCDFCLPGWGYADCATQCGGLGAAASYGPPGRPRSSPCIQCKQEPSSYSFNWMTQNDLWSAPPVARMGADSPGDCLAQYMQPVDGAWYLPLAGLTGVTVTPNVTKFDDCVGLCQDGCQFVTYDYRKLECSVRNVQQVIYDGAPYVAFKGFSAGQVGASSVNRTWGSSDSSKVRGKKDDFGQYTIWWDPNADQIGNQVAPSQSSTFTRFQNALDACDFDTRCVGVTVQNTVHPGSPVNDVGPKTAKLVYGDVRQGQFKRTVVRMEPTLTKIPTMMRVCRDEPPPVFHGRWPTSCRGTPVNGQCVALCDCWPDECYARDGCPVTTCQEDGTWGPFFPEKCALAIPAQPQAISCPTPMRPGLYSSRRRQLLSSSSNISSINRPPAKRPTKDEVAAARAKALAKLAASPTGLSASSRRSLLWAPPSQTFTAMWSEVRLLCPEVLGDPPYQFLGYPMFGQSVAENWMCDGHPTGQIIGIAAQDFVRTTERYKWETLYKSQYTSYVWSQFMIPGLPDPEGMWAMVQGMQLMIVGNVGTDHPCFAECSVTGIELAFYTDNNGLPSSELYSTLINLDQTDPTKTFRWSTNETATLNFDVNEFGGPVFLSDQKTYWMRLKLVVPFNGTDGTGLGRCYAYVALKDTVKGNRTAALWMEAGGYNTSCIDTGSFPGVDQTVGNCNNGGGPGLTTLDACNAITQSNTCAPTKYGADIPRSCPFGAKDIVYSLYGFSSAVDYLGGAGGAGGVGRR